MFFQDQNIFHGNRNSLGVFTYQVFGSLSIKIPFFILNHVY